MTLIEAYLVFVFAQYIYYLMTEFDTELGKRLAPEFQTLPEDLSKALLILTVYLGLFLNCLFGLALLTPLDPYFFGYDKP